MTLADETASSLAPPVDTAALIAVHDGPWAATRHQTRDWFRRHYRAEAAELDIEAQRARTLSLTEALALTGLLGRGFPAHYGGSDDVGGAVSALGVVGSADLSLFTKIGVQWGLFGGAILHLGTQRHHERLLPAVLDLDLLGCFAMTETGHGSNVQSLRTTASYDPAKGVFVLDTPDDAARKDYIGNAGRDGRSAVVFAQLEAGGEWRGVHALVVPIRTLDDMPCAGVSIEDCGAKAGLNGVDNGRLWFDHVEVEREALLDRYASVDEDGSYHSPIKDDNRRFFTMLGTLIQGRVSVAAGALGAAKTALSIAIRYGEVRRQFERPGTDTEVCLLDYRSHQRRLLPALAATWAMHFAQDAMVRELHRLFTTDTDDEAGRRALESRAAGLKAAITWHASRTVQACREACGGAGYLAVNRLPGLRADADIFTTFEGDNTVLMQLVGKELLSGPSTDFEDRNLISAVTAFANRAKDAVVERTGGHRLGEQLVDTVRREEAEVVERAWHQELFDWRERHVVESLTRRVERAGSGDGQRDLFEAINDCQDHLLLAARVHIDRVILDDMADAVAACADPSVAALLSDVCALYALASIEADRGWFMEHGRLSAARSKAVVAAVNTLCASLRPHARTLVDGFAIPDEVIAAPIAL